MDEYDEMISTIARLQSLYSDVATLPPDQLVEGSDATLMFIQFYRAGELFDEVHHLENQFFNGLHNLKKMVRAKFVTKHRKKEHKAILRKICRVLGNIFEAGNYSVTVEVGTFLIKLIESSDLFNDTKIELQLLVGQAKFHMGQYSDGMDHIELALLSTSNIAHGYGNERSTACWYLIPRIKYINTCYSIKQIIMTTSRVVVSTSVYLILSPFPFNIPQKNIPKRPILPLHLLSHTTTLTTMDKGLEIIKRYSILWIQFQLQTPYLKTLSRIKAKILRLSFLTLAVIGVYLTGCVLFVWLKLILVYYGCIKIRLFRKPLKSRLADYHFLQYATHFTFYAFALDKFLSSLTSCRSFTNVKDSLRKIRDPRFRYGEDETPHSKFLEFFDDELFSKLSVYRH